jgi:acyl-CoA synthetase (AMP-forming)/AMP-acid ligase II
VSAVGVADKNSGEAAKIIVERRDPKLTDADLFAWYKVRLSGDTHTRSWLNSAATCPRATSERSCGGR